MGESHTVEKGDTLASIAHKFKFRSWEPIWEDPSNASLREKRKNPMVLVPGDVVNIPEKRVREVSCETNKRHTFKLKPLLVPLRFHLTDETDEPYANVKYTLSVDGESFDGVTTSEGVVEQKVPGKAKKAEVTVFPDEKNMSKKHTWTLDLGHLQPIDTNEGVKARLHNLGYNVGEINDTMDDNAKRAIRRFQEDHGLQKTGELNDETRKKLEQAYLGL
jgi:N-acetylmuramoyl-L-alanine amidase